MRSQLLSLIVVSAAVLGTCAWSAERVSLKYPGGTIRGQVLRVTKSEVVLKVTGGKEKVLPIVLLKPADVYACRKSILEAKDAKGHYELGEWCHKSGLKKEAKDHFDFATALDPTTYKPKVAALQGGGVTATKPSTEEPPKTDKPKTEEPKEVKQPEDKDKTNKKKNDDDEYVEVRDSRGRLIKIPKRFMPSKVKTKPKTADEVKKFIEKRLADLKSKVGGTWRHEETKHYYVFSNVDKDVHDSFKRYNEQLYDKLCEVLQHKDGDPLWHNKCPIYYFKTHRQFQKFAAAIDGSPGAGMSGGYFMHRGRDVHICIPFYSERGKKQRIRTAFNTLCHEGTHAFLQLVGEDVSLSRWIHEGMAQLMEFYFDDLAASNRMWGSNNVDKHRRLGTLRSMVSRDEVLGWDEGRQRPAGGMDTVGYAFAWSRIKFLNACFDKRMLPKMIKLIKSGTKEPEAIQKAFGKSESDIEDAWIVWLKYAVKKNFKGM